MSWSSNEISFKGNAAVEIAVSGQFDGRMLLEMTDGSSISGVSRILADGSLDPVPSSSGTLVEFLDTLLTTSIRVELSAPPAEGVKLKITYNR